MRTSLVLVTIVGTLALTSAAIAGGWATVELSSLPTAAVAGKPWIVQITVLQHGRTPLNGLSPKVRVRKLTTRTASGSGVLVFAAKPTGRTGVYRARVVFPSAGTWKYEVWDGFVQYGGARWHTFAPVKIAQRGT